MGDNVRIVQATINELEELAAIFDQYRVFYKQESNVAEARSFLFDKFEHRESVIFLAKTDERIVGFTQLYPSFSSISMQRSWILNDLFVASDYRQHGIGRLLLHKAKEHAVATRAKGLALSTAMDNHVAQSLYESLGYQKDDQFYHYYLKV